MDGKHASWTPSFKCLAKSLITCILRKVREITSEELTIGLVYFSLAEEVGQVLPTNHRAG